jgi:hypothetical protein
LPVPRTAVVSRSVRSLGYDPEQKVLEVEWRSGAVYRYFEVPAAVAQWLERVRSKGAFLNRLVKESYRYEQVEPHPVAQDLTAALRRSLEEQSESE